MQEHGVMSQVCVSTRDFQFELWANDPKQCWKVRKFNELNRNLQKKQHHHSSFGTHDFFSKLCLPIVTMIMVGWAWRLCNSDLYVLPHFNSLEAPWLSLSPCPGTQLSSRQWISHELQT
jgi:hypothetical protein